MAKISLSLILIICLGLCLRLVSLNQSFWLDEAAQAEMSVKSLSFIWSGRGGDFHPPLFYFLAHFWLNVSHSEIWARLLPVLFGVTTIWLIYFLAGMLIPVKKISLFRFEFSSPEIAAFLLAINPYHIYYSQEFRAYSLLALLATLSMYLFLKKQYVFLTLINILLFYTHYSAIYIVVTQLILAKVYYPKIFRPFVVSLIFSLLVFLPWAPQFKQQLTTGLNISESLPGWEKMLSTSTIKAVPTILFKFTAGRITFLNRTVYGIYAVFVFAVIAWAFILARFNSKPLHAWLFIPLFSMLIVSYFAPQNQPFRIIFCLIPLILIFTQSCLRFPKIMLTLLVYIALVGNISYFSRPRLQREQWRQTVEFLRSNPGIVLIKFPGVFAPLSWYGPDLHVIPLIPDLPLDISVVTRQLSEVSVSGRKLYLLDYLSDLTDPHRQIDRLVTDLGYVPGTISDFSGVGFVAEFNRK